MTDNVHPNDATANAIRALVAAGLRQIDIATYLKISTKTLHEHQAYKDALDRGAVNIFAAVGSKIVKAAIDKEEPWALKLIATRRMGWNEKVVVQPEAPAAPEAAVSDIDRILAAATPEELDMIDALLARTAALEPGPDAG
jgi:hypothetical protein